METNYKNTVTKKKTEAESLLSTEQFNACNEIIQAATSKKAAESLVSLQNQSDLTEIEITMVKELGKVLNINIQDDLAETLINLTLSMDVGAKKTVPVVGLIGSAAIDAARTTAIGWSVVVDLIKENNEL